MKKSYFTLFIALIGLLCSAQTGKLKKADKSFDNLAYIDAIAIYKEVAASGFQDADLFQRLGDAYYFNADYAEAAKWYDKLFKLGSTVSTQFRFRYGQSLKAIGAYEQADQQLAAFYKAKRLHYVDSDQVINDLDKIGERYTIERSASSSSQLSDYPAFLRGDTLYVISKGEKVVTTPWNNQPTSDIYVQEGEKLANLGNKVNTKFNEGSLAITKDGKTMYFTRNDFYDRKLGKDSERVIRLKLYKARWIDNKWETVEELPFNSSNYSVAHPALSPDDSKLFFVSDMPSSDNKGGTDLYAVTIFEDGGYGALRNLKDLNTPGNEAFPFIDSEGMLFFSSNGHPNLGGLDVFQSPPDEDGLYSKVYNLGKPVNSPMDDFGFVFNSATKKGYFASNRETSNSDDIFSFTEIAPLTEPCEFIASGNVIDASTNEVIDNAVVTLLNDKNEVIAKQVAEQGKYAFADIDCKHIKAVRAESKDYLMNELFIAENPFEKDIPLSPRLPIEVGVDIASILNPIYFDLDKHNIRPDAAIELQKVIAILRKHPKVKIDVRSHTDSQANDAYNLALSKRRAKATIDYLVNIGGIDKSRITGGGYGESQLVNRCTNGVPCSESEHQENRRSEFIIVEK